MDVYKYKSFVSSKPFDCGKLTRIKQYSLYRQFNVKHCALINFLRNDVETGTFVYLQSLLFVGLKAAI